MTDQEQASRFLPAALDLPAHDRLLADGTSFSRFHVNTLPCSPSRSVFYTGHHTQKTGMVANHEAAPHPVLPTDIQTIGHYFQAQGYNTVYKGKWHLSGVPFHPPRRGPVYASAEKALEPYGFSDFNYYGDPTGRTWTGFHYDRGIAADAGRSVKELAALGDAERPWFLAANFVNPHDIMFFDATGRQEETRLMHNFVAPLLPEPADPLYAKRWDVPLPESLLKDDLTSKPSAHLYQKEWLEIVFGRIPRDDEAAWLRYRSYYYNCLRDVDRHVLTLLNVLRETEQADNTIVIYTTDHGERAGAHGLWEKGGDIYAEEVQIPFIVTHPDVPGGHETGALGSAIDTIPTVLGLAGLPAPPPDTMPGIDLSPAVANPHATTSRDEQGVLFNYAVRHHWDNALLRQRLAPDAAKAPALEISLENRVLLRGIHAGRHKFARYFAPADHHVPRDWGTLRAHNDLELYDVENDPDEIVNLAAQPEKYKELILDLNARTNRLVEREVGEDLGAEYPGDPLQYRLKA